MIKRMAYANLASLPPVYGMYTSFFTSTFYAFFGTSRHISIGVFAVASLMVGAVRLLINGSNMEVVKPVVGPVNFGYEVSPVTLTSALAMAVGLFQVIMAMMGLAFLTTYMSDALISGFTTGSAFHVFTAQLNKIIGVKLPRYSGFSMLFFMMRDLMLALPQTNYWTLCISILSIIFLFVGHGYVNPWFKKRSSVPLPIELILVILVTIFSVYMDLKSNYGVKVVDYIPQGIPTPSLPNFDLIPYLLNDAFAIAIISYMFVVSMAKLFAKKRRYKIDPTQDLYAVGLMHTLSSFFPIFPAGGSLSRSAVCEQSGANTQLNILFSNTLLLTVIVFIGPFLEPLPMCVLACIVIVSLRSLFMQFGELSKLWRISKFDFAVWLVSCIATVSFDVMTGLMISVLFTLISVVLREQRFAVLFRSDDQPLIYYRAALNFITVSSFLSKMSEVLRSDSREDCELQSIKNVTVIIIDCGAISNIDTMGVEAIKEVYNTNLFQFKICYFTIKDVSYVFLIKKLKIEKNKR
uniref:BMA-SULP-8, isoform a n=1 Tax=Brugia malayi TaxID=6279 RepID=A0A1I9G4M5_BRUMA|nr:BMA-SULP-8, isoform a [Brugia malayi]